MGEGGLEGANVPSDIFRFTRHSLSIPLFVVKLKIWIFALIQLRPSSNLCEKPHKIGWRLYYEVKTWLVTTRENSWRSYVRLIGFRGSKKKRLAGFSCVLIRYKKNNSKDNPNYIKKHLIIFTCWTSN